MAEAEIFAAHLALLDDEALLEPALAAIDAGATAERAWLDAAASVADTYRGLDAPLLRERAADVTDVGRRVAAAITRRGRRARGRSRRASSSPTSSRPAAAAGLDPALVRGVATARGTPTAHAAILARALGLPAVVGLGGRILAVPGGSAAAARRRRGLGPGLAAGGACSRPPASAPRGRRSGARPRASTRASRPRRATASAIEVAANVDDPEAAAAAVELGAEGVGLLRTEFMFLDRPSLPTEDEQAELLGAIARALDGRPLIVRTLDAGADKPLPARAHGARGEPVPRPARDPAVAGAPGAAR